MSLTVPTDYPGMRRAKAGDTVTVSLKVSHVTPEGFICDLAPPVKRQSAVDYLKSVNKKPITPRTKLPL